MTDIDMREVRAMGIQQKVQDAIGLIEESIRQGVPLTPAETEAILDALKSAQTALRAL